MQLALYLIALGIGFQVFSTHPEKNLKALARLIGGLIMLAAAIGTTVTLLNVIATGSLNPESGMCAKKMSGGMCAHGTTGQGEGGGMGMGGGMMSAMHGNGPAVNPKMCPFISKQDAEKNAGSSEGAKK